MLLPRRVVGGPRVWPWALVAALALGLAIAPVTQAADDLTRLAEAVNAYRAQNGLPPLTVQAQLNQAAQGHADYLARTDSFNHYGAAGSWYSDRIRATGYQLCGSTESIAAGAWGPDVIVRMWASSSGHRANVLSSQYTEMGVGRSQSRSGEVYWVLVEGQPCAAGAGAPQASTPSLPSMSAGLTLPVQPFSPAGTNGMPGLLTGYPLHYGAFGNTSLSAAPCAGNLPGCWPFSGLGFSPSLNGTAAGVPSGIGGYLGSVPYAPGISGGYGTGYGGPLYGLGGYSAGGYGPWGYGWLGTAGYGSPGTPSFGGYASVGSPGVLPGAGLSPSGNCPLTGLC